MVESLRRNLTLLNRCESDEFSDRLILYANTNDEFTVRLNFRASIPYEQPHNHRSSFAALILSGSYSHAFYSTPSGWLGDNSELPTVAEIRNLQPSMVREEHVGSMYSLHHGCLHSTTAASDHISLVIKGPSVKNRLLLIDSRTQEAKWLYGETSQIGQPLGINRMVPERLEALIGRLSRLLQ